MHRQAEWRCGTMDNGALCVGTLGMIPMPLWCAGGWGIPVVKGTGTLDMDGVRDQSGWTTWTATGPRRMWPPAGTEAGAM